MNRVTLAAVAVTLVAGCTHDGIQGATPVGSSSTSSSSSSVTSASSTTASVDSNPVKGTTFDACTAITDADVADWKVNPADKRDAHKTAFGQNVRGCIWGGPDWFIKVYAVDGSLAQLEQPNDRFDSQQRVQVGSRSGWLLHDEDGIACSVGIPSQQAIAAVQIDLKTDSLALQIMRQIEPKIP
ncbi:DUF3558 family protein [Mycobacteroides salmoniphilum]|nr:DUF3558 family protein [Mycobacteroides salmoniphilum]